MPRDAQRTRTAILDAAERLTLERGFAGASLDAILEAASVSKGAFFHHFDTKGALADALIQRWAAGDRAHLEGKMARAERLVDDPLEQLLVFVGLFIEEADEYAGEIPGCLFAAFSYQSDLFDPTMGEVLRDAMLAWRRRLRAKLDEVVRHHGPPLSVDLDTVADSVNVVFEGAYVVARATGDPTIVGAQLRLLRTVLRTLLSAPLPDRSRRASTS